MSNTLVVLNNNREVAPLVHNNEAVITTKMLAGVYECEEANISNNFKRNKDKFIEGKHYYKLQGKELKEFKTNHLNDDPSMLRINCLYLWTKRGASRHCKMLGTDKAWDMFDVLEENYFNPKRQPQQGSQMINKQYEDRLDRLEDMVATMVKSFSEVVEKLVTITKVTEQPKSEQISFINAPLHTPYTATKIGEQINRKPEIINKVAASHGIITKTNNGWVLNKKYEEAGYGKTCNDGQWKGTFVRYSEKGAQEIKKIFNK